jgi:superfamily II DNA/RNA helicase
MSEIQKVLDEREKTHGDFSDVAFVAQNLKAVTEAGKNYTKLTHVQREAMDMILAKMSRILSGNANTRDHWEDISGYATLVVNSMEKK